MATMLFGIDSSKLVVFQNLINKAFALFFVVEDSSLGKQKGLRKDGNSTD